jgi:hypothetical protein
VTLWFHIRRIERLYRDGWTFLWPLQITKP